MTTIEVQLPFLLAPHQALVRNAIVAAATRFFVLVCGRRSGKTLGAVYMTVEFLTTHPNTIGWWVAPTFPLTRKGMRETIHFLRSGQRHLVKQIHRSERRIEFVNGSFLEFRSAHDPDSQLVSEGLDWLVVDEAGLIGNPDVWPQYLRPALADRQGKALFITSPRGRNWLWDLFTRGQDPKDREVVSWQYSTAEAGFVLASELAEIERTTPVRIWQQEYLAKFLDDGGDVFRKVEDAIAPARIGKHIVVGIDLARTQDWTVLWASNEAGEWVAWERFQDLDWAIQKQRIVAFYKRVNANRAVMDTTGMHVGADAVVDELRVAGLQIEPIVLTGTLKRAIVESAMVRFDQGAVTVPNDPVVLDEFKRFTYTVLPSETVRYRAQQGHHDDIVIACVLALWGIRQFKAMYVQTRPESEIERELREIREERELSNGQGGWFD